ncbi:MAG: DUF4390 domain-containing protein [Vicinamibacterales bacterium]
MRRRRFLGACVGMVLGATAALSAQDGLRIVPLVRDDQVVVSFDLADVYSEHVREAIASGLRTTVTYDIELRMVVPGWVDRTIATSIVTISDQYDNLTRRHLLSRSIDGRVVEALTTEDEAIAREWLTGVTRLPLVDTSRLDSRRDYYVRVAARARPNGASLLNWASAISGQATFTFIP